MEGSKLNMNMLNEIYQKNRIDLNVCNLSYCCFSSLSLIAETNLSLTISHCLENILFILSYLLLLV